jgi:protein translocase SecG subunit
VLVASVLLQPGKTDAGALFTSNISSSAFAPRGTTTVLSKLTIAAAATFMLTGLLLSMPALTGNVSVLSSNPETSSEAPANTNANTNSNANPADTNSNSGDSNTTSSANSASDNSNAGLVQTPATDEFANKAANANAANGNSNKSASATLPPKKK